jgi:hypothetical protein
MRRIRTTTMPLPPLLSAFTLMAIGGASLSGCGDAGQTSPRAAAPAEVTLTDAGSPSGVYPIDGPHSLAHGAVRFSVTNNGKTERGAELVAVAGDHGLDETFAALIKARDGAPTPGWVRWAGGIGVIHPGQHGSFTVDLTPGRYYVIDRSFKGRPATLAKPPMPSSRSPRTTNPLRFRQPRRRSRRPSTASGRAG